MPPHPINSLPLRNMDQPNTSTTPSLIKPSRAGAPVLPEGADFVDRVFAYLLAEFPQIAGPRFARAEKAVREELAGERVYVTARGQAERQALAHEVLALFDGRNATEVARRLNIGRTTVYRVLKQAHGGSYKK